MTSDKGCGPAGKRALRIVAWPAFSNAKSNLYQTRLYQEIGKEHAVDDVFMSIGGLYRCLTRPVDVMHIHWIEKAFWGKSSLLIVKRALFAVLIVLLLKLKGARIVWTAHDPVPHDMAENHKLKAGFFKWLWLAYRGVIVRGLDGVIFLTPSHIALVAERYPRLARLPNAVTPHPHYRGVYSNSIGKEEARAKHGIADTTTVIGFVGKIRPYKNVDGLLRTFRDYAEDGVRLLVAGEIDSRPYGDMLAGLAAADSRITLVNTFIPDDRLQEYLNAADVVILPFREVTNSGSLLLALSFDRPVAVPSIPVFREIRDIVGSDWIYLYEGDLTEATLRDVVLWCRSGRRSGSPPMESLSWPAIAGQTVDFYRRLLGCR